MSARALLLALMLGGCSVSGVETDWMSDDAAGPEPVNYRFLIAIALDGIVGRKNPGERMLEISSPRRMDVVKGATWLVCVRSISYPAQLPRAHYSVFIQRDKIVDSHLALGIEQCESQPYAPFEWSRDITNPVYR